MSRAASAMLSATPAESSIRVGLAVLKTSVASVRAASRQGVPFWNECPGWLQTPITVVVPSGS
jgi:hypothetical protein